MDRNDKCGLLQLLSNRHSQKKSKEKRLENNSTSDKKGPGRCHDLSSPRRYEHKKNEEV